METFIVNKKIVCDIDRFVHLKNKMSIQNGKSDPCILKISFNINRNIMDIEYKTSDINKFP